MSKGKKQMKKVKDLMNKMSSSNLKEMSAIINDILKISDKWENDFVEEFRTKNPIKSKAVEIKNEYLKVEKFIDEEYRKALRMYYDKQFKETGTIKIEW